MKVETLISTLHIFSYVSFCNIKFQLIVTKGVIYDKSISYATSKWMAS